MEINKLQFLQTWSINDFKEKEKVERVEIRINDTTGKCFFVYGEHTGACSKKAETGQISLPVISEVCSPVTGDLFYLLHQKGENPSRTLAVL
jgi:hypothetical protein